MENLQYCVYFILLIIFGRETAGATYFTVQSQHWSSYFNTLIAPIKLHAGAA